MNKNSKVLKSGIWYTISNFLVKGLAFITMPIFTRIMTKGDIGLFSNITSWFNILAIIATFELYSSLSIARFDYKDDIDSYISSNLILGTIITLVFYVIFIIFHDVFEELLMLDFFTMNIIFVYLLFYPSVQMYQLKNQFTYNFKSIVLISIISALSSTILSLILVFILEDKLLGRTVGYFLPLIVISIIVYMMLIHGKQKKINTKYWKYALCISVPLIFHLLAGYLLNSADKIMITKIVSSEANALYSVSYSISLIVSLLWSSMNNAWSPWAYEMMDKKDYNKLKENSKPYLIFFCIIVYLFMLITPELLLIMGGNEYINAKYVMPPVMIGYIFQFVYSLYVNIEFYHKKQKNIAIGTMIACLINIVLNFLFIPIFGYIAAAYTTLIGYIILYLINFIFVVKLKCKEWYDNKFFIKILILSLIILLISNLLYYFNIVRYSIVILCITVLLTICLKNKNEIIRAIKNKSINDLIGILKRK